MRLVMSRPIPTIPEMVPFRSKTGIFVVETHAQEPELDTEGSSMLIMPCAVCMIFCSSAMNLSASSLGKKSLSVFPMRFFGSPSPKSCEHARFAMINRPERSLK